MNYLKELWKQIQQDNLMAFAGNLTYSAIFALFPFLLFLVSLAAIFHETQLVNTLFSQLSFLPNSIEHTLKNSILVLVESKAKTSLSIGAAISIILSLWGISGGMRSLITALNSAYDVDETRPFWKVLGISILLSLTVPFFLLGTLVVLSIPNFIFPLIVAIIKWPILICLVGFIFAFMYWLAPNVEQPFKYLTPGSVLATIGYVIFTVIFSLYVNLFPSFTSIYGTLSGVILLLLYIYYSSIVFLIGAEINQMALSSKSKDTTPSKL